MTIPDIALNDGASIPQLGFGVYKVPPMETEAVTSRALDAGYRHIDTAQMYKNEEGVGRALAASGLTRDEVFVTTKLNNDNHLPDEAKTSFARSLELLGLDRVDLFLIHWPLPTLYDGDFVSTWRTLIALRDAGLTRSIGVSNFQPDHLRRIIDATDVVPAVNQIEVHPYFGNTAARAANKAYGIATEAWAPIAQGAIVDDPTVSAIAERLGATPSQVGLAWHLQRGDIVFPKTVSPDRMRENLAAVDVVLTDDDMASITALDQGEVGRRGPDPDVFDRVR